jgi:hypothetical protein
VHSVGHQNQRHGFGLCVVALILVAVRLIRHYERIIFIPVD